jgi:hypothetical protein
MGCIGLNGRGNRKEIICATSIETLERIMIDASIYKVKTCIRVVICVGRVIESYDAIYKCKIE